MTSRSVAEYASAAEPRPLAIGIAVALWMAHVGGLRGEDSDPGTSVLSQMLMMSNVLAGTNLPNVVWSLSYEMIFYLLLAALFMARIHWRSSQYTLGFAVAAVTLGGLLPQAYFTDNVASPRIVALVADLVVLAGLALAVVRRGMPRFLGAVLAAVTGLALLAFNGTWLPPWEALSILALMFTGTMLGAPLGLLVPAGRPDVRDRAGATARQMAGHADLVGPDQLLGVPAAPGAYRGLRPPGLDLASLLLLAAATAGRVVPGHPARSVLADLPARGTAHADRGPSAGSLARCPVRP